MTSLRQAAQQALEALESAEVDPHSSDAVYKAIADLRAALAEPDYWQEEARRYAGNADYWRKRYETLGEPVQEPVAWMVYTEGGISAYVTDNPNDLVGAYRALPLYTTPPQRPAEPATIAEWWADKQRNFCPRCGKRTNDIHTCTPP